jgi:hypothetical protein
MNVRLTACVLLALSLAPAVALRAEETSVPIVSNDAQVRKDLAALDQALNDNPKLAEALAANLDQITQDSSHAKDPEVAALIKQQPGVVTALKSEPHFLLHRAIGRIGRTKVLRADAIKLDAFLNAHPDIAGPLDKHPRQIADPKFLAAHPPLAQFLDEHPGLSTVLMERADGPKKGKAANAAKDSDASKK